MHLSITCDPHSPGPLASLSEKELGYCVLGSITSDAWLTAERTLKVAKAVTTKLSTRSVTPRAPPPPPSARLFVFSAGQCKETLGKKELHSEFVPSTHSRAVGNMQCCVLSEVMML